MCIVVFAANLSFYKRRRCCVFHSLLFIPLNWSLVWTLNIEHLISSSAAPKRLARHSYVLCMCFIILLFHISHHVFFLFQFLSFRFVSIFEFRVSTVVINFMCLENMFRIQLKMILGLFCCSHCMLFFSLGPSPYCIIR